MNLINLENVAKAYGPSPLLDGVSLGLDEGDRVGVVGRNGGGKSTLVSVLARETEPDGGRVTHARGLRLGHLTQRDAFPDGATVRSVVLGDRAEHEWAGEVRVRDILAGLLADLDLDAPLAGMSGGERRRVALARLLVPESDLLLLDEPTNHLDIEAIDWLARHLRGRKAALLVVTHDRWFLDEVTDRTWEVVDGRVERYEGGYSAYVLAKAERARIAAATEAKRQNLLRKELAWLRRGPQARTSKPKFRVDAAQALIADEPPLRDSVELTRFATARLGKTVYDVEDVTVELGGRDLFTRMTWRVGPGDRVGLVGVNGSGKSTLLRLLDGSVRPVSGTVVQGKTVQLAHLSQNLEDLDPSRRVLESVEEIRGRVTVGKREWTASQLLERLGFPGDRQWTPVGDLSGGERRRLQLLRLLMGEPNVLLLDEPTNDLDIETLTEVEDLLDGWPGTLVVVSHDRYFLERITDHVVALLGDGRVSMLPGGVDEYLQRRAAGTAPKPGAARDEPAPAPPKPKGGGQDWKARKELDRLERRLEKLAGQEARLHEELAAHATDYARLQELDARLKEIQAEAAAVEEEWLMLAEDLG
ncbi:ABC-F family ATP-binding cassette domain-containing protein [Actinomadura madurae]|uniref:ABC-F family ATP-binding cassette domain-containing protein n=1 Tax=Actinomadura madurae TaxID=1993 RepID=UPI0020D24997|nr:ABC-F family ATP-binding cassette domain-containing protein [Actinomadura madurae]MCP9950310.1 ABC-F family ATP-binding cassette domain-containing protein [Actinomadura madurae]MCP9979555.1 ABC-F family ATP-binding cassette domain-containing protein [Actinomadura madurae]MCQ0008916.1 ABC-F family ATP-binding cassette domain-containing protein [Actinomadura madurae]MCQ0015763.1 ABC-F family ATP-binding cassette domain-containing protein [Actinomadura madurae]